jgi:hypothetical protein
MISIHCFVLITFGLLQYSYSLQSGFTCETSVTLKCPDATKLIILEVTYSSECPNLNEEKNGGAQYAPSRCIGYNRERASSLCNGKQTCTVDNNLPQRPAFVVGKQSNCVFTGQSMNIDYSCIPDFYSSKLPRIDICSLQSLNGLTEGFIHTPNYPSNYPNSRTCSKTVPSPDAEHRLKIYALDFDIEGLSVLRWLGITRINDWLQINNSGEKMFGTRPSYTLLFDDVIEASLMFKSDFANTKRPYNGFLLYFIVTPIRGTRPPSTTSTSTEKISSINQVVLKDESTSLLEFKSSALVSNDQRQNNVGLTLLVILLSGILFIILCAFLLYKRRNDRRVRYLTDMFNSFFPIRPKNVTLNTTDNSDETTLNNTIQSKLDVSTNNDEKFVATPVSKHVNVNEKRENQEKQIFIDNLKTCPSPYSSYRRSENKFNSKEQLNINSNIYSQDPLVKSNSSTSEKNLYEDVDLNQSQPSSNEEPKEEVIYDVINSNNERPVQEETDYDSVMYATPKNV